MALSGRITGVNYHPNGHIYISYDDGTSLEYADFGELQAAGAQVDSPGNLDVLRALLLGHWHALDPAMDNSSLIIGKTLTLDMTQAQAITVQEP